MLMLLLAGCQTPHETPHPTLPPPTAQEMDSAADKACAKPGQGLLPVNCRYIAKMQYGIQRNFYNANQYHGRECLLTIHYSEKGSYDVVSTSGDEILCKKAWGVVSTATYLPPPPEGMHKTMGLDFKPGD